MDIWQYDWMRYAPYLSFGDLSGVCIFCWILFSQILRDVSDHGLTLLNEYNAVE